MTVRLISAILLVSLFALSAAAGTSTTVKPTTTDNDDTLLRRRGPLRQRPHRRLPAHQSESGDGELRRRQSARPYPHRSGGRRGRRERRHEPAVHVLRRLHRRRAGADVGVEFADDGYQFLSSSSSGDVGGWRFLNLNNGGSPAYSSARDFRSGSTTGGPRPSQAWVVTSMFAEGRYSVEMDAMAVGNGCSPAPLRSTQSPIGPAPNATP